jgi:LIVCS family branched-chain amino acid:cation transporter
VILVSLYPGKLLDTVGNFLAPLKIIALIVLAVAAIIWPAGPISDAMEAYRTAPFSNGFVNGYLTMDTLGAMVFGIVIVNAARSRGVSEARLLTRYTVWAGLMAGVGLTLLYLALFRLGLIAPRWWISPLTARRFCMPTSSTPSAARAASCWRR